MPSDHIRVFFCQKISVLYIPKETAVLLPIPNDFHNTRQVVGSGTEDGHQWLFGGLRKALGNRLVTLQTLINLSEGSSLVHRRHP